MGRNNQIFLILLLTTHCFIAMGDVTLSQDGAVVIWNNNSQTFSIAASGSMSESVDYIWPAADAVSGGLALLSDSSGVLSWGTPTTSAAHNILSGTHDATTSAVTRGDIIIGDSTPEWDDLAIGANQKVLVSDGTDPSWGTVDISGGTNLSVTSPVTLTADDIGWNSTLIDATTWSDGGNASNAWTFDVSGTDHTMTAGDGIMTFSHEIASGVHTITTGSGSTQYGLIVTDGTANPGTLIDKSFGATNAYAIFVGGSAAVHYTETDYQWRQDTYANIMANTLGGANLLLTLEADGDILAIGDLTGLTKLEVDNITLDGDTISASGDLNISPGGANAVLIGKPTNHVSISVAGVMTLVGDARVLRSVDFEPGAIKKGGVGPADSTEDSFPIQDFDATNDESVFVHWEIPHEYASAGEIHLHVEFFVDTAPAGAANVTWGVEYKKLSIGDNFAFTGTTTVITNVALTTGTPANDKKIHSSAEIHLVTTGFEPMDVVLIRIFRDANASEGGATDNFGSDARVFNYHLMFLSDKMGQAI